MPPQIPQLPLRDVHIPSEISWFPLAIGWWLLLVLVPLSLFLCYRLFKYLTRKTAVKMAKQHLKDLQADDSKTEMEKLTELAALLRRVAMSVHPRSECASLTGQDWLNFLDHSFEDKPFSQGIGQCFASNLYQKEPPEVDFPAVVQLTERWLKKQTGIKKL